DTKRRQRISAATSSESGDNTSYSYMKCVRCGADLAPDAERCVGCGASSRPVVASGVVTQPPPYPTGDAPTMFSPDIPTGAFTSLPSSVSEGDTRAPGVAGAGTGADGPLEAGQTFGPRYHIIRELGVGG